MKKFNSATKRVVRQPAEYKEQIWYMDWALRIPVIKELVIHIANERKCSLSQGILLKRMGVRVGVSDIFLPLKTKNYSGLWIELKRKDGGTKQESQKLWLEKMREQGFKAEFANGWVEAKEITERYFNEED